LKLSVFDAGTQRQALQQLAELAQRSFKHPLIVAAADLITADCAGDDECEVTAVFEAVKHGDSRVRGLNNGVRYLADPSWADYFTAPYRLLEMCERGACAEDCDGHTMLIVALLGARGFPVGLRVWGRSHNNYVHVYPVVGFPRDDPTNVLGLDTTVDESSVGWQPLSGEVATAWIRP